MSGQRNPKGNVHRVKAKLAMKKKRAKRYGKG